METYRCPTVRPTGDPAQQPKPRKVSSVFMEQNFTHHAYSMAHDGKTTIVHLPDGIEVHREGRPKLVLLMLLPFNPRDFYWHPDSKRVAFWVLHTPKAERPGQNVRPRRAVAVMDVTNLPSTVRPGDPPPYQVVYTSTPEQEPFGLEWSPRGDALYLIQRGADIDTSESYGALTRIELNNTGSPKEIVRMPGSLDFFMPPVSRFERGEGPSSQPYSILYGTMEGLYTINPDGTRPERLSNVPAIGLYNVEWNPKPTTRQVALFFKRAVPAGNGRMFVGAYLVRLDALRQNAAAAATPEAQEAKESEAIEQLYDDTDVHTLWYSPRGTYVTWASPWGLWYRRPEDKADKAVQVRIPANPDPTADGATLEIKGVTWHDSERKLAFTAGNKLFICELPSNEVYQVAEFGTDASTFVAEPRFVGEEVFLTAFEDARASGRIRSGVELGMPGRPADPSMGRGRVPTAPGTTPVTEPAPTAPAPTQPGRSGSPRNN
jgi:hypothetical protein